MLKTLPFSHTAAAVVLLTLSAAAPAATITVLTNGDAAGTLTLVSPGVYTAPTLRAAIDGANSMAGADTINFQSGGLAGGQLITAALNDTTKPFAFGPTAFVISSDITIAGSRSDPGITISGNNTHRIFGVMSGASLTLQQITLSGGLAAGGEGGRGGRGGGGGGGAGLGGAIFNNGTLNIQNSTLNNNVARGGMGGAPVGTREGGGGGGSCAFNGGFDLGIAAGSGNGGGGGGVRGAGGNSNTGAGGANENNQQAAANSDGANGGGGGGGGGRGVASSSAGFGGGGGGGNVGASGGGNAGSGGFGCGGGGGGYGRSGVGGSGEAGGFGGGGGSGGEGSGGRGGSSGSFYGGGGGGGGSAGIVGGGGGAGFGGAIFNNAGATLTIVNSTLTANVAAGADGGNIGGPGRGLGGAVFNRDGTVTIRNSTLAGNEIGGPGGGTGGAIANVAEANTGSDAIVNVFNSILADNIGGSDAYQEQVRGNNPTFTGDCNIIESIGGFLFFDTTNTVDTDPNLGALASNGGPTKTMLPAAAAAINTGSNAQAVGYLDQRGFLRNAGGTVDLGALETGSVSLFPLVVDTLVDENDGNFAAGDLSLREAVALAELDPDANTITFAPALTAGGPATLKLSIVDEPTNGASALLVDTPITISGPTGANGISFVRDSAAGGMRLFRVNSNGNLTLQSLTLSGGNSGAGSGGAIFANASSLTVQNCTFSGNTANSGGAISSNGAAIVVDNSTFSGNSVGLHGGAMYMTNSSIIRISNSTFSGNQAGVNGGALNTTGNPSVLEYFNLTITNNRCGTDGNIVRRGGGIYAEGSGRPLLRHSIVADNYRGAAPSTATEDNIFSTGTGLQAASSFNLIGTGNNGSLVDGTNDNQVGVEEPRLAGLANNGGPTQTHALLANSPAINMGDPAFVPPPTTDQRGPGFNRVIGGRIDIGALEQELMPPAITSGNATTFTVGAAGTFQVTATGKPSPLFSLTGAPAWLSINLTSGAMTGTPPGLGAGPYTFTFAVTAANAVAPDATQNFTLTVNQPPAVTSANAATFTVGTAGIFQVAATGNPVPTFSLTGAPAWLSIDTSGLITGTPPNLGAGPYAFSFTVSAANAVAPDATQNFTLTVNQPPAITSANAATLTVGTAGTFQVAATGNPVPTFSLTGAPAWLSIDTSGLITGTPPGLGAGPYTFTFAVTAANAVAPDATQNFTLTVNQPPAITSANAATLTSGVAGTFTATATGNPTPTFSLTGAPSWFSINAASGVMSGTPPSLGAGPYSFTFTVTAANGIGANATQNFTLNVNQAPAITSANAATFTSGVAGTFTATATGNPAPTFSLTGAPAWLSINAASGVMSGTPPNFGTGPYAFTFTVTAANGIDTNAAQNFTLTVNQAPAITSANATTFTSGTAGTFTATATGNPAPTFSLTGAPTWLSLNAANGVLSGTPPAPGVFAFAITAANGIGTNAAQNFTLTVNQAPAITSANAATFTGGTTGTFTTTASGTPSPAFTLTGAPTWLSINSTTGVMTGTPPEPGTGPNTFTLTITAANGVGTNATQAFTLTVNSGANLPPLIDSVSFLPAAPIARSPIAFSVVARDPESAALDIVYDFGDGSSGKTPTHTYSQAGIYKVVIKVSDGVNTIETSLMLTVAPVPLQDTNQDGYISPIDIDSDSDGFADYIESSLDLDPVSAASNLLGGAPAAPATQFKTTLDLTLYPKLNSRDTLKAAGELPLAAVQPLKGRVILLDVSGRTVKFTLNSTGRAKAGVGNLALHLKSTPATFTLKLSRDNIAPFLALNAPKDAQGFPDRVMIALYFEGKILRSIVPLQLKAGRNGALTQKAAQSK